MVRVGRKRVKWIVCVGLLKGWCGHRHKTFGAASACISKELMGLYTDRQPYWETDLPRRPDGSPYLPAHPYISPVKRWVEDKARRKARREIEAAEDKREAVEWARIKRELQLQWKGRILARDGHACRACGSTVNLDLAHVTPVDSFVKTNVCDMALEKIITASYRDDNLLILCKRCHLISHHHEGAGRVSPEDSLRVKRLFSELMKARGRGFRQDFEYICSVLNDLHS